MIERLLSGAGQHPEAMQKIGGLLGLFGLQANQ
jgi:hypothetical protein